MKTHYSLLAVLFTLGAGSALGADMPYTVKYRQAIMEDGRLTYETRRHPRRFRVEIVSDREGQKNESSRNGRPYVTAQKGERYSVRLHNPLPVRVAVNLTVDGLNSITGKPSGIADGHKWIIEPYSSVTIPGWQVSGAEARRFFFTDKPKSYAKWRGDEMGRDLEANCGVIGAAYFWNKEELDRYYEANPIYRTTRRPRPYSTSKDRNDSAKRAAEAPASLGAGARDNESKVADEREEQAGTGMGERESHPTVQVDFTYNTGMYSLDKALVIYYGFESAPVPNPFPDVSYAPEMP